MGTIEGCTKVLEGVLNKLKGINFRVIEYLSGDFTRKFTQMIGGWYGLRKGKLRKHENNHQ